MHGHDLGRLRDVSPSVERYFVSVVRPASGGSIAGPWYIPMQHNELGRQFVSWPPDGTICAVDTTSEVRLASRDLRTAKRISRR